MNLLLLNITFLFLTILDVIAVDMWSFWPLSCPDGYKRKDIFRCAKQDCPAGYFGDFCEEKCRFPSYGKNCQLICDCGGKLCHVVKGCPPPPPSCHDGYLGKYCETKCPYPNYGQYCQRECLCPKSHCNFSSGCLKYMNDSFKNIQTKPSHKFSTQQNIMFNKATQRYPSGNPSTIFRKDTDPYLCPDGFHGSNCKTPCRYPSYGTFCQKKCFCSIHLCNISSGCSRSNQEDKNQSFATRRSTVSSESTSRTTDETVIIKLTTGGNIYSADITDVHSEGKMEAKKARNEVKEIPRVNKEVLWSIVVFAVLTVSLVIGHIYLTFSKRLQKRGIQSPENVYSIAGDE
ncbi:multiple epidermal growth factor-like domains protein 11 [Saccostrea cucullata]|uniref:multiple epidermal growth factor-like domains protein 11 n=1 Tax=Saccostrea cuccullata TaxID=36930 RepID=UPI002ED4ECF3